MSGGGGYAETAALMNELVCADAGAESVRMPGGLGIGVSRFGGDEVIKGWCGRVEHRAAQKCGGAERGGAEWYESFSGPVATVERSYGFVRD